MDRAGYLDVLQRESTALLAAARLAEADASVPGCPEWTVTDLVWHMGEVHDFWGYVVRERSIEPVDYDDPPRPGAGASRDVEFEAVHTFAGERAAELHRVLCDADPDTPVWSWTAQKDAAFVLRRMAHETAVHRIDAEQAAGRHHHLDADLAADGIDEFLTFFLSRGTSDDPARGGSVHIHCTDDDAAATGGEWTVRPDETGTYVVTREHTKSDVALRGGAHDLLMTLWRRAPIDAVTVLGDRQLAELLIARSRLR